MRPTLFRLRRPTRCSSAATARTTCPAACPAEATDIGLLARLGRMDALPPEHKAGLFRLIDAYLDSHEVPHGAGALARSRSLE